MRQLMLAVAVLAIAGCAPKQYTKEGVSDAQAQADSQQCRQQASLATASMNDSIARAIRMNELVHECFQYRGYK